MINFMSGHFEPIKSKRRSPAPRHRGVYYRIIVDHVSGYYDLVARDEKGHILFHASPSKEKSDVTSQFLGWYHASSYVDVPLRKQSNSHISRRLSAEVAQ